MPRKIRDRAGPIENIRGQDLIEYALVVALIALAAVTGAKSVATKINAAFDNIGAEIGTYTSWRSVAHGNDS